MKIEKIEYKKDGKGDKRKGKFKKITANKFRHVEGKYLRSQIFLPETSLNI